MIEYGFVRDILLDLPGVSNIMPFKNQQGSGCNSCTLTCDLLIRGNAVPVKMEIPDDWARELVHIFVVNVRTIPFIPHMDPGGKLCLFDLEGVLIDLNLEAILRQCVERAIEILDAGIHGNSAEEFVREFSAYWSYLPEKLHMRAFIKHDRKTRIIGCIWDKPKRKDKENDALYIWRCNNRYTYAYDTDKYYRLRNLGNLQKRKGLYCAVNATDFILPPDYRKPVSVEYFNRLLMLMNPLETRAKVEKALKSKLIVFHIVQPNQMETDIAVLFQNGCLKRDKENHIRIVADKGFALTPIDVEREDKQFLLGRTEQGMREDKKILLIGCGSIGGYMCNELVKAGVEDITLVDNDRLKAENIYRHLLGMEYVGHYKAEALCNHFEKNLPALKMKPLDEDIRPAVEEGSIKLDDYDLIVSAVGNHNVNRWLNQEMLNRKIDTPVLYEWNEPLDIGCHVAVISRKNFGDYECFFDRNEDTGELYDAVAFTAPGQNVTRNMSGCGGTYIPYASTASLKTVSVAMDWLGKVLDGRCTDNYLISVKGEGYYFRTAGLNSSAVYQAQTLDTEIKSIKELMGGNCCNVCEE